MPYRYSVACGCMPLARHKSHDKVCAKKKIKILTSLRTSTRINSFPEMMADLTVQFGLAYVFRFCCGKSAASATFCADKKACHALLTLFPWQPFSCSCHWTVYLTLKHLAETPLTQPICSHKGLTANFPPLLFPFSACCCLKLLATCIVKPQVERWNYWILC